MKFVVIKWIEDCKVLASDLGKPDESLIPVFNMDETKRKRSDAWLGSGRPSDIKVSRAKELERVAKMSGLIACAEDKLAGGVGQFKEKLQVFVRETLGISDEVALSWADQMLVGNDLIPAVETLLKAASTEFLYQTGQFSRRKNPPENYPPQGSVCAELVDSARVVRRLLKQINSDQTPQTD